MLRVVYSNRIERLVEPLLEAIAAGRGGPLSPAHVAVPNAHVAQYLKLAIARRVGIAANLELPFLERLLCDAAPEGTAVLTRGQLHALLCSALDDAALLEGEAMEPVRAYLDAAADGDDERALRRYQLADQLAGLFTEYALSRPELIDAWRRGAAADLPAAFSQTEAWQRRLWISVFGDGGALARLDGPRRVTLTELYERTPPAALRLPPQVHLFGFSYLARAFYRILERLAEATDLFVYTLNPCREYWEDVSPLEKDEDTPALRLWGTPGAHHTAALNALTGADFVDRFAAPEGDTALAHIQKDVLGRVPARAAGRRLAVAEPGVRVLACPSARREAEIVADEIWALVEADPTLRFSDIGVLVTPAGRDAYQTHLAAAFRAAGDIPHTIADVPLARDSRVVDAVELLLALPSGNFARRELLRLITHPAVIARYPEVDVDQWLRWAEALAIVHGADRADHANTYIEGDRFNWDQGVRRLALGAFMAGDRSGDERAFTAGDDAYLPQEVGDTTSAARFGLLARSLIADARYCRDARLSLSDWSALLGQLVTAYLSPVGDDDERELDQALRVVGELRELDLDGREVPYRIARELVHARLGGLRTSRGELLTEGVAIATHLPMRPIPFRVVFVTGLGEGKFPASERESPLDLRLARRLRNDVTARDRDRYLFFETLLSARERLYLSYVARDEQTGESLQPSAVVSELVHVLERGYLPDAATVALAASFPLRRYQRPGAALEAHRERRALELREHLQQHLGGAAGPAPMPTIETLRDALPIERWQAIERVLGLPAAPPRATRDATEPVALSLYTLRLFLECPLQASASFLLGLRRDEEDDVYERDDEPFAVTPLVRAQLLRAVFLDRLAAEAAGDDAPFEALYDARATRLALEGHAPVGMFGAVEREQHLQLLVRWRDNLGIAPGAYRIYRFGRAQERSRVDELLPPLVLELADGTRVELYGKTEPTCPSQPGSLSLTWNGQGDKYFLRGYVDQAVLAAAELIPAAPFHAAVNGADALRDRAFAPLSAGAARAWLATLAADFLSDVHDYLLPCECVFDYEEQHRKRAFRDLVDSQVRRDRPRISSQYGPVRHWRRFDAPADADERIERRFGRFYADAEVSR